MTERIGLRTRLEHAVDRHSVGVGAWLLRRTKGRIVGLWRRRALVLTVRGPFHLPLAAGATGERH